MSLSVLTFLILDYINNKYNYSLYKLICNDLGLTNMIVKSKDDLTIVRIINLKWSYIRLA
jgi:hypothetical protein